jgi:hypothetical protein
VLGLKVEIDLIFNLLPLVMRDPNMLYIFSLYQPFITPLLHYSNTPARCYRSASGGLSMTWPRGPGFQYWNKNLRLRVTPPTEISK